jgi:hypothetical protein
MILACIVDRHASLASPESGVFCTRDRAFVQAVQECLPRVCQEPDVAIGFAQALDLVSV